MWRRLNYVFFNNVHHGCAWVRMQDHHSWAGLGRTVLGPFMYDVLVRSPCLTNTERRRSWPHRFQLTSSHPTAMANVDGIYTCIIAAIYRCSFTPFGNVANGTKSQLIIERSFRVTM
jgi:hypothetical protein